MLMQFTKTQGGFFNVWREDPKVVRLSKFIFFGSFIILLLYCIIIMTHFEQKTADSYHSMGIPVRGEGAVYFPLLVGGLFYLILIVNAISFVVVFSYSLFHVADKSEKK